MARSLLIAKVPLEQENVLAIDTDKEAKESADSYGRLLSERFGDPGKGKELDVALLCMGREGELAESAGQGKETWAGHAQLDAGAVVSLSSTVLNRAFAVLLMAEGYEAGRGLAKILYPDGKRGKKSRSWLDPSNRFVLFLDREARQGLG